MNVLVYMRSRTATVATVIQTLIVKMRYVSRFAGSLKFGITPTGGVPAGPANIVWSWSGLIDVLGDVMIGRSTRGQGRNPSQYRAWPFTSGPVTFNAGSFLIQTSHPAGRRDLRI